MKLNYLLHGDKQRKYKCPYCLHEFTKADVKFCETNLIRYGICPNNKKEVKTQRPVCGRRLPLRLFNSESIVISLIGGTSTGKTYFFVALERILADSGINRLGISGTVFFPPGDIRSKQYYDNIKQKINHGQLLDATAKDQNIENLSIGLQVNICKKGRNKTIYFTMFDNPGEGFRDESYIIEHMNIKKSDAIIFLISPEQTEEMIPLINCERKGRSQNTTPFLEIINKVSNILTSDSNKAKNSNFWQRLQSLFKGSKTDIPVAFCLSKYDLIQEKFKIPIPDDLNKDEFEELLIRDTDNKTVNWKYISNLSEILNDRISSFDIDNITNNIPAFFAKYHIFGIQSITIEGQKARLTPKGISLPILWILNQLKLLR